MTGRDTNMSESTLSSVLWLARSAVLAVGLASVAALAPSAADAQEVQITGPLAGQPAVRHMRLYRGERFRITPAIGYSLQDEFSRALFFGGEVSYHFVEWLGVGIWGAGAPVRIDTDLTTQVGTNGQITDRNRLSLPSAAGFTDQVGRITWGLSLHLLFIPLRGKLSLFQAGFVDTDLYVIAGVAVFGVQERAAVQRDATGITPCDSVGASGLPGRTATGQTSEVCLATQRARADRVAPAPMLGVGLSLFFNDWIGMAIEWRAFPFSYNTGGTDENGADEGFPDGQITGADSRTIFNHMLNVGIVINLPPESRISD